LTDCFFSGGQDCVVSSDRARGERALQRAAERGHETDVIHSTTIRGHPA